MTTYRWLSSPSTVVMLGSHLLKSMITPPERVNHGHLLRDSVQVAMTSSGLFEGRHYKVTYHEAIVFLVADSEEDALDRVCPVLWDVGLRPGMNRDEVAVALRSMGVK